MRFLHTGDLHVGKSLKKTRSRAEEHRAVLADMARIVDERDVDVVLIAGDNFDTRNPSAQSEKILYDAILDCVDAGAKVVTIAGNHDDPGKWHALKPLMDKHEVFVSAFVARPDDGGIVTIETDNGTCQVAMLPFLSQRSIVKADDILSLDRENSEAKYRERLETIIKYLTGEMRDDVVRVALGHLTVVNDSGDIVLGGGERRAHAVLDYAITGDAFPAKLQYVALGHLHAPQRIQGQTHIRYPGPPLHLDFSDTPDDRNWCIVDIDGPDTHAEVTRIPVQGGRKLVTVKGDLDQCVAAAAHHPDDAYVRVKLVAEKRPGLNDEVTEAIPNAVEVLILDNSTGDQGSDWDPSDGLGDPAELFYEYLGENDPEGADDGVGSLFREILDDVTTAGSQAA